MRYDIRELFATQKAERALALHMGSTYLRGDELETYRYFDEVIGKIRANILEYLHRVPVTSRARLFYVVMGEQEDKLPKGDCRDNYFHMALEGLDDMDVVSTYYGKAVILGGRP